MWSWSRWRSPRAHTWCVVLAAVWLWQAPVPRAAQQPGRTPADAAVAPVLPAALSDAEFWRLIEEFSEPGGYFQSENLVGNERPLQYVVPALQAMPRGGVYLGVAPDQNFTYIVALEPRIAFIVDIRRGNLLQHLMYKAIIELSGDRAAFLSRLFSRPRPDGLDAQTPVNALFEAYWPVLPDQRLFADNLNAIEERLTGAHGFPLTEEDLARIAGIYQMFFHYGPALSYSLGGGMRNMPSYADMQTATDLDGRNRGYLGSEDNFRRLKAFQERNLLVPVVGDFAGPKALRAVGEWLASRGGVVTAFYTSNVEQYLFRNEAAAAFYANVETLPIDESSVFVRSAAQRNVLDPILPLLRAFRDGGILEYRDVAMRGTIQK
jgi:hypothetical protein